MKHSDFEVGVEFFTETGKWRCTDADAAWAVEIQRRLDQVNAGTVESIPWEVVRKQVLDSLKAARRR